MSFSVWNLFQLKKFYNDFPFFDRSSSYCKQIVRTEPAILPNHRTEFDPDGRKKLHLRERAENVDLLLMSAWVSGVSYHPGDCAETICHNDELSSSLSWLDCSQTDSEFFTLLAEISQILLKNSHTLNFHLSGSI